MPLIDKGSVLSRLSEHAPLTVELGCGPRKRYPRSIGIDAIAYDGVDIVGDAMEALRALPDGSADLVTSSHFLEHVPDVGLFLDEMTRVVRGGGRLEVIVPHFAHPYFSSDPTHTHRFGLYTFSYLAQENLFRRRVPGYVRRTNLELIEVDLVFKSTRPFYARYAFKRVFGLIFNSSRYMQELYEENLCYLFPCYEVRYLMQKVGS
jgi:ubiquinone/menaquinone biosynthesis C-methylase UbiE